MKTIAATRIISIAIFNVFSCGLASAQSPTAPSTTIPEKLAPRALAPSDASKPGGNLSERLDQTNGVIRPKPDVDSQMEKPAPAVTGLHPDFACLGGLGGVSWTVGRQANRWSAGGSCSAPTLTGAGACASRRQSAL